MIPINRTYAPIQALVEELARCGLEQAVTCPGSRDAPLALTLAGQEGITCTSILDERSAGFFALGAAKASRRPVAVCCTSGTAAANLLPAVVEAHEAGVPLLVLTADRPPELRDVGARQSIDQLGLYGSAAKWFVEVGNHDPGRAAAIHYRALACRAYATARGGRPGPVQLNFPLREPLAPRPEELEAADWQGRSDGGPWTYVEEPPTRPDPQFVSSLAAEIAGEAHGLIVCGVGTGDVSAAVARLAAATGWPVLADPLSGVRCGPHDRSHVIAHYDVLLRAGAFAERHVPSRVIRIGDTPTSQPLRELLAGAAQIVIDPHAAWHEPTRVAERLVVASPAATAGLLASELEGASSADPEWLAAWRAADAVVPPALVEAPARFEGRVAAALVEAAPDGSTVWVSSSMPVRDLEAFAPQREQRIRFLANSGANGIDGVVSSALGAASASTGRCFLLTGDLALVHDASGLLASVRRGLELTIVCVNNGGGSIFDFLPLAEHADAAAYEEHVATPSGVDLERLAAVAQLPHSLAETPEEVADALDGPGLVEFRSERAENVRLHAELVASVAERLADGE